MLNTEEIKLRGRECFKLNYGKCVLVSLILAFVGGGTSTASVRSTGNNEEVRETLNEATEMYNGLTPGQQMALLAGISGIVTLAIVIGVIIRIFVYNPLKVGGMAFFKNNVIEPPAGFDSIGLGFKNYLHTFVTLFLNDLFISLWSMLFIIPGLVKSYSYRMVPYILIDEPDLSPTETITRSRMMMDGHKWDAFCYDLSFIGWFILTVLTCGILGILYVGPYKNSSDAALYLAIREESSMRAF